MGACGSKQKVKQEPYAIQKQPKASDEAVDAVKIKQGPGAPQKQPKASSEAVETVKTKQEAGPSCPDLPTIREESGPYLSVPDTPDASFKGVSDSDEDDKADNDLKQLKLAGHNTGAKVNECYELGTTVGKGKFAVVKLGIERSTQNHYAIKIMDTTGPAQNKYLKGTKIDDISKEISILMDLQHPNVVVMKEFFVEKKHVYIVTEYLSGGELLRAVEDYDSYREVDARLCFSQILDGIIYLHTKGVTHRDLKPPNILLAREGGLGHIKIVDFGCGKTAENAMATRIGTPVFMAPELLIGPRGNCYTRAVDLWSAGVVLFLLLGGTPPWRHTNHEELNKAIREAKFSFDDTPWASISKTGKDLVSKLLVVDPDKRLTAAGARNHPWFTDTNVEEGPKLALTRSRLNDLRMRRLAYYRLQTSR